MKKAVSIFLVILIAVVVCTATVGCSFIAKWLETSPTDTTDTHGEEKTKALATPELRVDGGVITWAAIEGADRYRVKYSPMPTGEPVEILVYQPQIDTSDLDLGAGEYLFVVRAECVDGGYLDGVYTPDENGVRVVVNSTVTLDDVQLYSYRVNDTAVLCTWTAAVGADVYHVRMGDVTVDSSTTFAVLAVDATVDSAVTLTVTGRAGYPYDGLSVTGEYKALTADIVGVVEYDKIDDELRVNVINPTTVKLDGQVLNQSFAGQLTLGADILRDLSLGMHYLEAETLLSKKHTLIRVGDTRPFVFYNGVGVVITEQEYTLDASGLVVYFDAYANTVRSVSIDGVKLDASQCSVGEGSATVSRAYMTEVGEGDHALRVAYVNSEGAESSATLTVHVSMPTILRYDAASGADFVLSGVPSGTKRLLGGGITTEDYTLASTTLTINAAYLCGLAAGTYDYWLDGGDMGATIEVYNSGKAPYDVVLSYDDHVTDAYGHFACDCGNTQHYYALDSAAYAETDAFTVALGSINKSASHTFSIYCPTNDKTTKFTLTYSAEAAPYMSSRYNFEGRNPDCFIGSVAEFCDVVHYLSYVGSINYAKGDYGVSEMTVYIGSNVMRAGDINAALNAMLTAARDGFSSPYNCSISAAGNSFNLDTRAGALTITVTFSSAIAKPHVNDIEADEYKDTRTLLVNNATPRTTFIESSSVTEPVNNVQELADLPIGVRPVFSGSDDATTLAKDAYYAAVAVCKTYIRDSMTTTQKLQVMYDYLSHFVTYDYYALVWYEVDNWLSTREYNQYVAWHNAAVASNQWAAFSEGERTDINACNNYYAASALVRKRAAEPGAKAFWTNWLGTFETFESNTLPDLRTFARQQVTARNYGGTSLDTAVESMCAEETYAGAVAKLKEMTAVSAFDAYGAMVGNVAVCDGIADAYRLLCMVEGIPCLKVSGIGNNSSGGSEAHAWNKVYVGGSWYCVDATWSKAAGCVSHRYFMVPDSVLSADHHEQVNSVDSIEVLATATDYDYYANTIIAEHSLYAADLDEFDSTLKALYNAGERTIEIHVASNPGKAAFENSLKNAVGDLKHLGGISYTYVYTNGYALIQF